MTSDGSCLQPGSSGKLASAYTLVFRRSGISHSSDWILLRSAYTLCLHYFYRIRGFVPRITFPTKYYPIGLGLTVGEALRSHAQCLALISPPLMISKRGSEILIPVSYTNRKWRGEVLLLVQGNISLSGLNTNHDNPNPRRFHAAIPWHFFFVGTSL